MTLTNREAQIVAALAVGKTLKEIAWELDLHDGWVRRLVCDLRSRMGYRTTAQMMWELRHASFDVHL